MVEWYCVNKSSHQYPLGAMYKFCGYSRQSYYQEGLRHSQSNALEMEIVEKIISCRLRHPAMGLRKLYGMLKPAIGRDKFFALARAHNL